MEWGWKWKSPIVLLNMADYDESTMLMTRPIRCLQSSDAFPRSFLPAPPAHVYISFNSFTHSLCMCMNELKTKNVWV